MIFDTEKLKVIAQQFGLELIVLFGSQARNETTKMSDIDIAVLAEPAEATSITK